MGHIVTGIIAKDRDAKIIADVIPFQFFYPLRQKFVIFPVTDELLDKHIPSPQNFTFEQFTYLSAELAESLQRASSGISLAYIETEYFGGEGYQSAVVFEGGKISFGPIRANTGPINDALRNIGVLKAQGFHDEFESIGLGNIRSCEDLLDNE